uniref:No apical meristem-associated C-terminal domain-containing protein n=1 Tax=Kalanchoe fedtschenkoi TaxID=63787 RepID=A0A7N0RJC7_KALFE
QPEEENPEHALMMENEAAHNITRQEKNSRHIMWRNDEEKMLISSWLTISNDSAVKNSQTSCSFGAHVARYFNTYRKTKIEREESQIKSHYYLMMPNVNEFNGYYNQIVSDHHSGWSDTQIIQAAQFPYTHVWEMMKDLPKWTAQVGAQNASKKIKTSDSGAYTSSSHHDIEDNTHKGNKSESRPIGQKAAKRKMRGKEKNDVTESVAKEFDNRWKRMKEFQAQKLAVLNEIKNKEKDDTLRADYEILMKETSKMSDQQLIIHNHMCSIIKARYVIS